MAPEGRRWVPGPSEAALVERLTWMLCESFSPYDRHLDRERADDLVEGFIREVLGRDSGPRAAASGHGDRSESAWSIFSVRPDVLTSTGCYAGESEEGLAYFDGGDSDTATLLYRNDLLYLLLPNGSP
jgi:hypothetical protein